MVRDIGCGTGCGSDRSTQVDGAALYCTRVDFRFQISDVWYIRVFVWQCKFAYGPEMAKSEI